MRASALTKICRKFDGVKLACVHLTGQCVVKTFTMTNKIEFPTEITIKGNDLINLDCL